MYIAGAKDERHDENPGRIAVAGFFSERLSSVAARFCVGRFYQNTRAETMRS
jgi:hypothetical protein